MDAILLGGIDSDSHLWFCSTFRFLRESIRIVSFESDTPPLLAGGWEVPWLMVPTKERRKEWGVSITQILIDNFKVQKCPLWVKHADGNWENGEESDSVPLCTEFTDQWAGHVIKTVGYCMVVVPLWTKCSGHVEGGTLRSACFPYYGHSGSATQGPLLEYGEAPV